MTKHEKIAHIDKLASEIEDKITELEEFVKANNLTCYMSFNNATFRKITEDDGIAQWMDDSVGTYHWMTSSDTCW